MVTFVTARGVASATVRVEPSVSSGSVSLVPGVRIADAERLAERVSHGGKLI